MPGSPALQTEFVFHIEYTDERGHALRDQQLTPLDFSHAIRHTRFDAVRRGMVAEYEPHIGGARIDPMFLNPGRASPRAKGFRVTISLADAREHSCDFDTHYFASMANQVRAQLQRTKQLSDGAELYYRVLAFLDEEETERLFAESSNLPSVTTSGIALATGTRRRFLLVDTWDNPSLADLPVLVDLGVIEEIVEEARRHPDCEIAGFLLGHLQRDERTQEVFVVITGMVSATGTTEASSTSVTYTPSSFALARQIMKLRSAGELIIGWFHSHPFKLCAECPLPTPPECIAKILFYSLDDVDLMQSTFQLPYMVGLLAAVDARIEKVVGHLPVRLYGWCNGEIKPRGFDVVRVESNEPASIQR